MGTKSHPIVTFECSQNHDLSTCREVNQSRYGKPSFNDHRVMLEFGSQTRRKALSADDFAERTCHDVFDECGILATV
jgi:hypothetical protein